MSYPFSDRATKAGRHFSGGEMEGDAKPFPDGPTVAAGSRKRGRDIRGLDRFRAVLYGENGFRRLHAMVARNPIIMYPPDGIEAARARFLARAAELQEKQQHREAAERGQDDNDSEDDVFALFEARKRVESVAHDAPEAEEVPDVPVGEHAPSLLSLAAAREEEAKATYHHKQLDSYLRLLYEFNHVTLVKIPMEDTLQLLSRCGKESVAHVVEYETQVRLDRQKRIRELNELRLEQAALEERRLALEDAEQSRLVLSAEERQAELDLELGKDFTADPPRGGAIPDDVHEIQKTNAPSVHFAPYP